jgi:AcrR family transcriptional regulator
MTRTPGRPEAIDRATLIAAALRVIDSGGIGTLTMRRLATELGVSPMAPYRHVASKEELLRVVAEEVVARIEVPAGASWQTDLERFFVIFRERLLDHPGVAGLFAGTTFLSEVVYEVSEPILASLLAAGFDPDIAVSLFLACATCTIGSAVLASGAEHAPADGTAAEPPSPQRYPAVSAIFDHLAKDPERRHTAALRAVIAGFAGSRPPAI